MWIALKGLDEVPTILSYDECIDWIYERLENPGPETETMIQLIIEKDDPEQFMTILSAMAENELSDWSVQKRKWRVWLLHNMIENLPQDPTDGIATILEFWLSLGDPVDRPIQVSLQDRNWFQHFIFSKENYEKVKKDHIEWISKELSILRRLDEWTRREKQ